MPQPVAHSTNENDFYANAHKQSAEPDKAKVLGDKTTGGLDLGSRWCPEEIEIFFTRKSFLIFVTLF